jgi:hypothetical protein
MNVLNCMKLLFELNIHHNTFVINIIRQMSTLVRPKKNYYFLFFLISLLTFVSVTMYSKLKEKKYVFLITLFTLIFLLNNQYSILILGKT